MSTDSVRVPEDGVDSDKELLAYLAEVNEHEAYHRIHALLRTKADLEHDIDRLRECANHEVNRSADLERKLGDALEHWDAQASAWMKPPRAPTAIPGWMKPALEKGRAALKDIGDTQVVFSDEGEG